MPTPSERPAAPPFADPASDAAPRRRALDAPTGAVADALLAVPLSLDAVRRAAVRYGHAARDLALPPEEMSAALRGLVRRCAARRPAGVRAELEASVAWWAVHGYHRAD
jgi:hypothetical protein